MAVKIRLTRTGKKKQPTYRVVVMDGRKPRDGKYIEQIGRYDARQEPSLVEIDNERALDWLHKGAQPTERAQKLLEISGAWAQFRVDKGEIHTIGEHQAKEWPEKVHVVEAAEEVAGDQLPIAGSTSEGLPEEAATTSEGLPEEAARTSEDLPEEAATMVEEPTEPEAQEDATPEASSDTPEVEPEEAAEEDSNEAG